MMSGGEQSAAHPPTLKTLGLGLGFLNISSIGAESGSFVSHLHVLDLEIQKILRVGH